MEQLLIKMARQLDALDEAFRKVVAQGHRTEMIFGSPFSIRVSTSFLNFFN